MSNWKIALGLILTLLIGAIFSRVNWPSVIRLGKANSLADSSDLEKKNWPVSPTASLKAGPSPLEKEKPPLPSLSDLRYPAAETIRLSGDTLYLRSSDTAEAVTAWYKTKITNFTLNLRNFVQTNTNGNISNQLIGTDDSRKIKVDIDKVSESKVVSIAVTISNFNE